MFRQFFRDSVVYGATNMLARGLPVLLLPFFTRVFSREEYGVLDFLTIVMVLVNLTIALEISQAVGRFFTETEGADAKRRYASTALWFTVGVYTVFAAAVYASADVLAEPLTGSRAYTEVVRAAALATWAAGIFYLVQNQLRWELRPQAYAASTVAGTLVTLAATLVFVTVIDQGLAGVFYGQVAGGLAGTAIAGRLARRHLTLAFDAAKWKEMLAYSVPLVPSSVAVFVGFYVDRFAIREVMTLEDVGLYGAAYRVASVVGLVMVAAQGSLTPLVFTHYRDPATPGELARIFRYFVAIAAALLVSLALFAEEVTRLVAGRAYESAAPLLPLLAPAFLLFGMYIFAPGLFIERRSKLVGAVNGSAAALGVGLSFALVAALGIVGAALARFATALISFTAFMIFSQRLYPVPHDWSRLGAGVGVAVTTVAAGVVLPGADDGTTDLAMVAGKGALALAAIALIAWVLIGRRDVTALARRIGLARG